MTKVKTTNTPGDISRGKGRPTDYTEDMPQRVFDYIAQSGFKYDNEKGCWIGKLPSKAGLAIYLGVTKPTLYDWAEKYEDFSYALSHVALYQEEELMNNGLNGIFNPTISKLILSSNHGYQERKDITSAGKEVKSLNFSINEPSKGHKLDSDNTSSEGLESTKG